MFNPMTQKTTTKFSSWASWVFLNWTKGGLAGNLGGRLGVGKAGGGEDGDLLAARNGFHGVNSDLEVVTRGGVDGYDISVTIMPLVCH